MKCLLGYLFKKNVIKVEMFCVRTSLQRLADFVPAPNGGVIADAHQYVAVDAQTRLTNCRDALRVRQHSASRKYEIQ